MDGLGFGGGLGGDEGRLLQDRFHGVLRPSNQEATEELSVFVILSEAKNLSSIVIQSTERFFGEKHASE
jgi:hypothetical protein